MLTRSWAILAGLCLVATAGVADAWDGTDTETGEAVEIGEGNLVRSGQDIEVYDYGDGKYHNVTVESIDGNGSGAEVEVYDQETGESRTLEMDGH